MSTYSQFERRKYIIDQLGMYNRVMVNDLAKTLNVSKETIRRDLETLDEEGKLIKIHGGAIKNKDNTVELFFQKRRYVNMEAKRTIARKASELIDENDIIAIEIGTTTLQILDFLQDKKHLIILTNAIPVVNKVIELSENNDELNWELIVVGGRLNLKSMALFGGLTIDNLKDFTIDKLISTCDGISLEQELTAFYMEDAQAFKALRENSKKVIMLVDQSKFNVKQFYKSGNLNEIDVLVTNADLNPKWKKALDENEIEAIEV